MENSFRLNYLGNAWRTSSFVVGNKNSMPTVVLFLQYKCNWWISSTISVRTGRSRHDVFNCNLTIPLSSLHLFSLLKFHFDFPKSSFTLRNLRGAILTSNRLQLYKINVVSCNNVALTPTRTHQLIWNRFSWLKAPLLFNCLHNRFT